MIVDDDADQQLVKRIGVLRRRWAWILEGGGACATAALVVSLFLPKVYRATTYILVSASKIGTESRDTAWQQIAMLPTFVPFVDNDDLIKQSLSKFHLDQPPYSLTVDRFRRRNYLDVQIPKSARLLEVDVEFPDAKLAAALANDLAERAVEFNDKMNAADTQATQTFLEKQLAEATERLAEVTTRRLKIQEQAGIENREKDLSILLGEKDKLSTRLGQLPLELAQDESKSKLLQQTLVGEPRIFQLKKSVTADRYLEKAAEKLDPNSTSLSMTEESLNTTREEIQKNLVLALASSAAERAGIQTATEQLARVNPQISQLLAQLALLRSEIDKADRDYALAGEAVKNATRLLQDVSVTVNSKSQDMKQIAPALIPERPVRPMAMLNTLLGFLLGVFLFTGLALAIENYREMRRPKSFAVDRLERLGVRGD
jgi:uncharacterized protein involved in exopolysaccharide biosynthesis